MFDLSTCPHTIKKIPSHFTTSIREIHLLDNSASIPYIFQSALFFLKKEHLFAITGINSPILYRSLIKINSK